MELCLRQKAAEQRHLPPHPQRGLGFEHCMLRRILDAPPPPSAGEDELADAGRSRCLAGNSLKIRAAYHCGRALWLLVLVLRAVFRSPLSLEGVFQMAYILPERLLALVRPAFDLVLRRIRSLKRCAQACGCKIETPRYACNLAPGCISSEPTFAGLRKTKKKKTRGPKKRGPRKKWKRGFLWQSLTSLEMQPGAKLQRISRGLYFAATRLHAAF